MHLSLAENGSTVIDCEELCIGLLVHRHKRMIHKGVWPCDSAAMAQNVCVIVGAEDRERLAAIIGDRSRPQKHVQRACIVFFSAERLAVLAVARRAGVSRPAE